MKIGKYIISISFALSLGNNCFAFPGTVMDSVNTVGGKIEVIHMNEDAKCFGCYSCEHLVLDKKIRILRGFPALYIKKKIKISPEKEWLLIANTCAKSECSDAINTIVQVSKDKKYRILDIENKDFYENTWYFTNQFGEKLDYKLSFINQNIEDYSIFREGKNIVIQEQSGLKVTINPDLEIVKKEIISAPLLKKEIKKVEDLKGEPGNSILQLPFIKKDFERFGLDFLKLNKRGEAEVKFDGYFASSISFKENSEKEYPENWDRSEVIWADIKNNYYILFEGSSYDFVSEGSHDFIIVSNLKQPDIIKATKKYLSSPDFKWGLSKDSKCYINSDTRSIPCRKILGK